MPSPNAAAAVLRLAADLLVAGEADGALDNIRVRGGGFVVEVRPEGAESAVAKQTLATQDRGALADKPAAGGSLAGQVVCPLELARCFLSDYERAVLTDLIGHPGTSAKDLLYRCRVEKSKFWVLWSNLQVRGLIEEAEGKRAGFILAPRAGWVADLLGVDVPEPGAADA